MNIPKELKAGSTDKKERFDYQGWSIDHTAGRPILMHNNCSVIEAEQAYGLLELINSATQPQGEPVEWMFRWDYDHGNGWCRNAVRFVERIEHVEHEDKSTWRDLTPLYAEQPAPVAVVLPEHRDSSLENPNYSHARGWNTCLDELKRLNPSL